MGGAERVLSILANRWSNKYEVSVLTIDKGTDFFKLNQSIQRYDFNIERKNRYNFLPHLKIIYGIRRLAKKIKPDYVISFVGKTNVFTLLALKHTKHKVIVCEHSIINQPDIDALTDFFRLRLYKKAYKIGVLSESIKKEFIEKYKNCKCDDVVVLPNPLVLDHNFDTNSVNLRKICKKQSEKIIVSLGRLVKVKRFDKLIQAFAILSKDVEDVCLIIFGEGDERKNLENLITTLKLETKVFLPGKTRNVYSTLQQADIFALSSRYEGLPMSIIEALYCGKPVIAFDVPGVCDLIENKKTGLLIPDDNLQAYADGLKCLIKQPEFSNSLGKAGKEFTACFSPENIDKIWEKILI